MPTGSSEPVKQISTDFDHISKPPRAVEVTSDHAPLQGHEGTASTSLTFARPKPTLTSVSEVAAASLGGVCGQYERSKHQRVSEWPRGGGVEFIWNIILIETTLGRLPGAGRIFQPNVQGRRGIEALQDWVYIRAGVQYQVPCRQIRGYAPAACLWKCMENASSILAHPACDH